MAEEQEEKQVYNLDYQMCIEKHEDSIRELTKGVKDLGFTFHRGFFKADRLNRQFIQSFAKVGADDDLYITLVFNYYSYGAFIMAQKGNHLFVKSAEGLPQAIAKVRNDFEVYSNPDACKVYLMKNNRNGYYKIGMSKDPQFREKTLQAEDPDVDLIWNCIGGRDEESLLHDIFQEKRLRGEWFSLNLEDLDFIKQFKWKDNG